MVTIVQAIKYAVTRNAEIPRAQRNPETTPKIRW